MSNALSMVWMWACRLQAAVSTDTAPASQPQQTHLNDVELVALSIGMIALVVWVALVCFNRRRISLAGTPGRPNKLNPLHILGVLAAWIGVQGLVVYVAMHHFHVQDIRSQTDPAALKAQLVAAVCCGLVMMVASLFVAGCTFSLGIRHGLGLNVRHWAHDALRTVVAFFIILPLWTGLFALLQYWLPNMGREHVILTAVKTLSPQWRIVGALAAIVVAPVAEEIFFRGLVQSMFRRYFGNAWAAILITAPMFAVMHIDYALTVLPLVILAVALGYLYERTGRLYAPILLHALFNGANVLAEFMSN